MQVVDKIEKIRQLQQEILGMQGFKTGAGNNLDTGLGVMEDSFPGQVFPTAAIHEFISDTSEHATATNGFIAALIGRMLQQGGPCVWVSGRRSIFPPALKMFGIDPERVIFIDLGKPKDVLWTVEQALKCKSLSAVIGELGELGFTESRRLQLAVEQSRVTGFIHRFQPRSQHALACVTRWKIRSLPSFSDMPGLGFPRWDVQLLKVRNGKPGAWQLEWSGGGFQHIYSQRFSLQEIHKRKTG